MHAKCGGDRQYYESRGSRSVRPRDQHPKSSADSAAAGMSVVRSDHIVLAEPPWPFSLLDSTLRVSLPYSVVLSVLTVRTFSFICDTDSDNSIRWPADQHPFTARETHAHVARRGKPLCHVRSCGLALFFGP